MLQYSLDSLFVVIVTKEGQVTLGAIVGEVSLLPALEAGDLVQVLESSWWTICSSTGMHPVLGLGVGHEGLGVVLLLLLSHL